jgi:hypothetical protein
MDLIVLDQDCLDTLLGYNEVVNDLLLHPVHLLVPLPGCSKFGDLT